MKYAILAVSAFALLSACNKKSVDLKDASVEDVAAASRDAGFITPGQWDNEMEILSVDMAGGAAANKAVADSMRQAMVGRKQKVTSCVSEEQARKPDMFAGQKNGECRYENFTMSGGKISSVMHCGAKGSPAAMQMSMNGTYSEADYTANVTMTSQGPGGASMTIKARNAGKRTGDCTASKG